MGSRSVVALVAVVVIMAGSPSADACSCRDGSTDLATNLREALVRADAVFFAKVERVVPNEAPETDSERRAEERATLKAIETFKGEPRLELTVDAGGSGDCTFPFKEQHTYLVYASRYRDEVVVGLCSRTHEVAATDPDPSALSALATLYSNLAESHLELGDAESAAKCRTHAEEARQRPPDAGPFFHGTRAELRIGELLTPGRRSNYQSDLVMNHVYFTALVNGAGLAAALAKGEGRERVYVVEPTGAFEDDPNVTDKKFPGNVTRSFRTAEPLTVIGELTDWAKRTPEELQQWREKLKNLSGKIIN